MNRRRPPLTSLLTVVAMTAALVPATAATAGPAASRHIVVLQAGTDAVDAAETLLGPLGLRPERTFRHALDAFTVTVPAAAARVLEASPLVAYVEADRQVRATAQTLPAGIDRVDGEVAAGIGSGTTTDVDIAIIDTGIDDHADLNLHRHVNCQSGLLGGFGLGLFSSSQATCEPGGTDDNGHGTHVAGTAAAIDDGDGVVGVAPGARLWGVKVLGGLLGSGSTSDVIAGIDYVTANADQIEVANMSLGGSGTSQATDDAIANATAAGVVVVVAAGNDGADAAGYTPANSPEAVTVSAITDLDGQPGGLADGSCSGGDDEFATYSNHGDVVDIAAPGSCVVSTADGGGTTSLSGTSMASPHVAGAAALLIAQLGIPRDGQRRDTVLADLLGSAAAQTGPCGFTNGVSDEPLLDLDGC